MANSKKYASLANLQIFLDNLKSIFAPSSHKHTISDLTDYKVDTALSSTSTNPVQNKVVDAEFEAIANAMNALDSAIDGKADKNHTHEAIQSDWSQNDATDPAYIKNRTHWVEIESVTFIDNEVIEFFDNETQYVSDIIVNDIVFVEGNTYLLTIDGTQYSCIAHILEDYDFSYIGNANLLDPSFENTLESFVILCYNNAEISTMGGATSGIMITTTLEGASHVISLSGNVEVYHKIDKKYLPAMIGKSGSEEGAEIFNDYTNNEASGLYSHAEGSFTTASGESSHTEGDGTTASNKCSHAEGSNTTASGIYSHAEGRSTVASGDYGAHAEGTTTTAAGNYSHSEGWQTTANSESQHVQGEWNIIDTAGAKNLRGTYAHIVGNGTSATARSNAHTLDWSGNAWFAGEVRIGGSGQNSTDSKILATTEYVNAQILSYLASMTPAIKVAEVNLLASAWQGSASPYSQVVSIDGVTEYSQVDLKPSIEQLAIFHDKDLAFVTENEDGVVTVYVVGDKPTNDYTIQVSITEVVV